MERDVEFALWDRLKSLRAPQCGGSRARDDPAARESNKRPILRPEVVLTPRAVGKPLCS